MCVCECVHVCMCVCVCVEKRETSQVGAGEAEIGARQPILQDPHHESEEEFTRPGCLWDDRNGRVERVDVLQPANNVANLLVQLRLAHGNGSLLKGRNGMGSWGEDTTCTHVHRCTGHGAHKRGRERERECVCVCVCVSE